MMSTALSPSTSYNAIAITAADGTTAKTNVGNTRNVRLVSSVDMYINFGVGSAPTASVTTGLLLLGGVPEYFTLDGLIPIFDNTTSIFISGLVSTGTGTLNITSMK